MSLTDSLFRLSHRRDKSARMPSAALATGLAIGAALAGTAWLVRRAARRAEARHPATGRFIEVEGVRLHYFERGQGPAVVLLHGNGAMAKDFLGSGLVAELAKRYRVIAIDRPGFGYSQRPRSVIWTPRAQAKLLQQAFAQLGLQRPMIVAHSWATLVALALAIDYPQSTHGLLLISGYYYPTLRLDVPLMSPPAVPVLGDVLRYTVSPLLGQVIVPLQVRQLFSPRPVPDAFWQAVPLAMMLRPWQLRAGAAESALMVPAAAALARHYGQLHVPVTLVAGRGDRLADYRAHTLRLYRELPDSRVMVLEGLGHMLHHAVPGQLAQAVNELFARSQASAPQPSALPAEAR